MKKKWKQMLAGMLAMLTLFVTIFSGMGEVKAASSASNLKLWYASVKEHGVITEFNSYTYTANIMYAMIDGSTAYCMNYAKFQLPRKMLRQGIPFLEESIPCMRGMIL